MAVDVIVSLATSEDAAEVGRRMRQADADEVRASSGEEPGAVAQDSVEASVEAYAVRFDGVLAFVWGVAELPGAVDGRRVGVAWLLTTALVEEQPKAFWRYCLETLPPLLERWDVLVNAIDARHVQALRWARRLGFCLGGPAPFGAAGLPFVGFSVTRGDLHV
jgi:hypothetical protein